MGFYAIFNPEKAFDANEAIVLESVWDTIEDTYSPEPLVPADLSNYSKLSKVDDTVIFAHLISMERMDNITGQFLAVNLLNKTPEGLSILEVRRNGEVVGSVQVELSDIERDFLQSHKSVGNKFIV